MSVAVGLLPCSTPPTLTSARAQLSFLSSTHFVLSNPNNCTLVCRSSLDASKQPGEFEQKVSRSILVERYEDGKSKRYVLDTNRHLQSFWEAEERLLNKVQDDDFSNLSFLLKKFGDFVLPASFPDDYLDYMLLQFPTNVTGWICHTLVTSSLLKAVGVGSFSQTGVAASTAAIQWVSKDGLGAIGRLFIGGRYGYLFDDDPRQWRMYADIIGSAGSVFELTTQLYPAYFLPLASLGNLMKAIARGLKDPSFRVIQNHFAISANLGEVAAKEEVWEVAAQLVGLALGILIMDAPGLRESYSMHAFTWLSVRLLHLWLRYQSLSVLKFPSINLKRARILVNSHVLYNTVPGYIDVNKEEKLLAWEHFLQPKITFGVPLKSMIPKGDFSHVVKAVLELYAQEKHVLFVNRHGSKVLNYYITYKVGATSLSVLKSLWQVYWLHNHHKELDRDDVLGWLNESLLKVEARFTVFLKQLEEAGWQKDQISLKVPKHLLFEEADSLAELFQ
ncbi:protein root UVB sensitive 5 isoform X2 [Dendrobium catenatum]|uniref:protein root UVB sensitive 5 isoform X2 n=1 Tax=Dendrobium catenatum TaxID=906689 RepID=UPI0010A060A9|nr:protein root UVB sensitive 5 isoform X2 [Dendrobium catenatum]